MATACRCNISLAGSLCSLSKPCAKDIHVISAPQGKAKLVLNPERAFGPLEQYFPVHCLTMTFLGRLRDMKCGSVINLIVSLHSPYTVKSGFNGRLFQGAANAVGISDNALRPVCHLLLAY